jgi:hypothetical protein
MSSSGMLRRVALVRTDLYMEISHRYDQSQGLTVHLVEFIPYSEVSVYPTT